MSAVNAVSIATRDQNAAIRPEVNVWVTASAGSGKTKVLTERVLALLLSGTSPQRILCLTFTKAAAAEMSNRISERLARWVTADEDALLAEITPLVPEQTATAETARQALERARRLFAEALDAPGGLQISTLHAFCQSLLRRFPIEARVSPHFKLMDERDTAEALDQALESMVAEARGGGDAELAAALAVLTARVHESNFADLMSALVAGRGKLKRALAAYDGLARTITAMRAALGLKPGETEADIIGGACADDNFNCEALRAAAGALARGSNTDQTRGKGIAAWLETVTVRSETFEVYAAHFITNDGTVRKSLATKAIATQIDVLESLQAEGDRLVQTLGRLKAARVAEGTEALMRLGAYVLDTYEETKIQAGLLDYDDLIQITRHLLEQAGVADWVLYKLDGGIDHILIDEAQDTNPDQWAIVDPIAVEFFAGEGRHEDRSLTQRTVFAVGDRKQSIYSFQGAAPREFDRMHDVMRSRAESIGRAWRDVPMNVSFRSAPAILQAVNAVFRDGALARAGVASSGEDITHLPAREGQAGVVEIWPLVVHEASDAPESWKPPVERHSGESPQSRLAAQVAARIQAMVSGEMLESKARPIQPGDIMVLVRRRTGFVEELVRHLKKLDVAVAGVDRMVLTEQLAVMDLVALGQFLLLPEDDLTLATVLKGPLVGLSEEDLFTLAYDRGARRLWERVTDHAGSTNVFGKAYDLLANLLNRTDYLTPAALYGHILVALDGRRKLLRRLGTDADDPIDEFMTLALTFERTHAPTLQGFLHWLTAGAIEVKRDLDQGGNAVRVITVHGAKGLEAPIVFLPDTAQVPTMRDTLLWSEGSPPLLFWAAKADALDPVTAGLREDAKTAQNREYHRLLYVAMTRARDRLYVCGWQTRRPRQMEETWYNLIREGLETLPQTQNVADLGILRLVSSQTAAPEPETREIAETAAASLPEWAKRNAPPEPAPSRPLAPSRAALKESAAQSPLKDNGKQRYQRGLIIHRLLQSLPDLSPASRRAAAESFVRKPSWGLSSEEQDTVIAETLAVLNTPDFAAVFAPGSRAEVSVTGLVGKHTISGQVDRLSVTDTEVWIIDYKTNRPPPRDPALVDPAYIFQMATYRAILRMIYPDRTVRCVLLWTNGPFMMELGDAQMDAILRDMI